GETDAVQWITNLVGNACNHPAHRSQTVFSPQFGFESLPVFRHPVNGLYEIGEFVILVRNPVVQIRFELSQSGANHTETTLQAEAQPQHRDDRDQRDNHRAHKQVSFRQFARIAEVEDSSQAPYRDPTVRFLQGGYHDQVPPIGPDTLRDITTAAALVQRSMHFSVL